MLFSSCMCMFSWFTIFTKTVRLLLHKLSWCKVKYSSRKNDFCRRTYYCGFVILVPSASLKFSVPNMKMKTEFYLFGFIIIAYWNNSALVVIVFILHLSYIHVYVVTEIKKKIRSCSGQQYKGM